jgi:hypothetical protein
MSIYRPLSRSPRSDVHHVAEHITAPERDRALDAPTCDWTALRKAAPAETLFATTVRWMAALPIDAQPVALSKGFPRIVNTLAALWRRPEALTSYLGDLLVDRRGGRRGFPLEVVEELHRLKAYYSKLHP